MNCPTCDYTMVAVGGMETSGRAWWCARCGTYSYKRGPFAVAPLLVDQVRRLLTGQIDVMAPWRDLNESVFTPKERP